MNVAETLAAAHRPAVGWHLRDGSVYEYYDEDADIVAAVVPASDEPNTWWSTVFRKGGGDAYPMKCASCIEALEAASNRLFPRVQG